MRTILALDDELLAKPQAFTGLKQKSSLVRRRLRRRSNGKAHGGSLASAAASRKCIPCPGGAPRALHPRPTLTVIRRRAQNVREGRKTSPPAVPRPS
jgi:Bacterial antitoxin of type II TA system, VapB